MNDTQTPPPAGTEPASGGGFWNRYGKMIVRLLIIVVILAGAIIYSRTQAPAPSSQQNSNTESSSLPVNSGTDNRNVKVTDGKAGTAETPATIKSENGTITVTTLRGQGYTHTARRALAEYLRSRENIQLSAEHKIYVEDYLQKHVTKNSPLVTGHTVSYSDQQIDQAIAAAQKLTARQLSNLHRYTLRVSNL